MTSAVLQTQGTHPLHLAGEPASKSILAPGGKTLLPLIHHNPNRKKVLFVTSEIADLVKTGGLGDVSAALPRAMAQLHDVRLLIPGYPQVLHSENPIHIIGELGGHAACRPARSGAWTCPTAW